VTRPRKDTSEVLPLAEYDKIVVGLSGGKDSVGATLVLYDALAGAGLDPRRHLELWHHHVDGGPGDVQRMVKKASRRAAELGDTAFVEWLAAHGPNLLNLFDWPVTESYCRAFAKELGLPLRYQWRHGGLVQEVLKQDEPTQPMTFERVGSSGGTGAPNTRMRYPAKTKIEKGRWCSSVVKIDVARSAICNDPRFREANVLLVTGERREESPGRAAYPAVERHTATTKKRRVDQWRPLLDYPEADVWAVLQRHGIVPHPAYYVGFSRTSCAACIFNRGPEWRTLLASIPEQVAFHTYLERLVDTYQQRRSGGKVGGTIDAKHSIGQLLSAAKTLPGSVQAARLAASPVYDAPIRVAPGEWVLPPGAYQGGPGPI